MSQFLQVEDKPGLLRDTSSHGIINTNDKEYAEYKKRKLVSEQKKRQEEAKEERINNLEAKMGDLETKLDKILELLSNGSN